MAAIGPINQSASFLDGIPNRISREWWRWLAQVGQATGVNTPQPGISGASLADALFMAITADRDLDFPVSRNDVRWLPSETDSKKASDAQLLALMHLDSAPPSSWRAYTPTITAGAGTFTTVAGAGRYQVIGKTVQVAIEIDVTTVGTAATSVLATLPVAANKTLTGGFQALAGVEFGSTNKALTGLVGSSDASHVRILFYDGTFPGASGNKLIVQGTYEAS